MTIRISKMAIDLLPEAVETRNDVSMYKRSMGKTISRML